MNTEVKTNRKTRLCRNIESCKFGTNCHYAHTAQELSLIPCSYGCECIFISKYTDQPGKYENNIEKNKMCFFTHPEETKYNYIERLYNREKSTKVKRVINPIQLDISDETITDVKCENVSNFYNNTSDETITDVKSENVSNFYNNIPEFYTTVEDVSNVVNKIINQKVKVFTIRISYND